MTDNTTDDMDNTSNSCTDLVKLSKQLSTVQPIVIVHRLSADLFATLKVVDDPNLINDEVLPNEVTEIRQTSDEPSLESEEEICIDISLLNGVNRESNAAIDDETSYWCLFCRQSLVGYNTAFTHYQLHVDYFPVRCSACDEANVDVHSFANHFRKSHPNLTKASYIRQTNAGVEHWILTYLRSQTSAETSVDVHLYCPACDWNYMSADANRESAQQKSNAIEVLAHIHQHIQYNPFECAKCRQNGIQFCVPVLDSRVRKHLLCAHSDWNPNTSPDWKCFTKKYAIPALDKFIANYLCIFGLKIPKKRFRRTKLKILADNLIKQMTPQNGLSVEPIVMNGHNAINAGINGDVGPKTANIQIQISKSGQPLVAPSLQSSIMPSNKSYVSKTENLNHLTQPILIYPSNNQLNMKPFPVESTDMGITYVDPKMQTIDDQQFSYVCVFCANHALNLNTKFEACMHYAKHFNYYPIVCLLCGNKFSEMSELLSHYDSEHQLYRDNIFHYLKEDQNVENWIEGFLDFQQTYDFKAQVSATFGDYCLVCRQLTETEGGMKMDFKRLDMNAIRAHINEHLNYFPCVCTICMHGGRTVRFSYWHSSISIHFQNFHGLSNVNIEELSKFIAKSNEIYELEKLVDELVFSMTRTIETKTITLKRKLDLLLEDISDKMPLINHLSISAVTKDFAKNIKLNNTVNNQPLKSSNILGNSMRAITPNDTNIDNVLKRESKSCEPFLRCYHCHALVSSSIQLQSHHQHTHPNLTIASYTPIKSDVVKHLNADAIENVIIIE